MGFTVINVKSNMLIFRRLLLFHRFCRVSSTIKNETYPLESYNVVTPDGYILTMHRIIKSKKKLKTPVLLQHGLWSSSDDWIVPGPGFSLSYLLADNGFDVWMGNSRGNKYSTQHTKLNPDKDSKEYWDFSWHEMGYFDLPVMIEKILSVSKQEQLHYIGHSQGTTIFFVMASTKPEMNKYIKSMYALAPVAYLKHMNSSLLLSLASLSNPLFTILNATGYHKLKPSNKIVSVIDKFFNSNSERIQTIAPNLLQNLSSYATEDVKKNFIDVILAHIKSGASFKSLAHFAQCTKEEACFRRFDYGPERNVLVYGQKYPPEYNLDNIATPLYFFYSDYDWLTGPKDIELLYKAIPRKGNLVKITIPQFNHLDFIWATNAKDAFYYDIVRNIQLIQEEKSLLELHIASMKKEVTEHLDPEPTKKIF